MVDIQSSTCICNLPYCSVSLWAVSGESSWGKKKSLLTFNNRPQAPETQAETSQEQWCMAIDWERRKKLNWTHSESKSEAGPLLKLIVAQLLLDTLTQKRACLTIFKKVS